MWQEWLKKAAMPRAAVETHRCCKVGHKFGSPGVEGSASYQGKRESRMLLQTTMIVKHTHVQGLLATLSCQLE
jgi:hypothetical protein